MIGNFFLTAISSFTAAVLARSLITELSRNLRVTVRSNVSENNFRFNFIVRGYCSFFMAKSESKIFQVNGISSNSKRMDFTSLHGLRGGMDFWSVLRKGNYFADSDEEVNLIVSFSPSTLQLIYFLPVPSG